MNDRQTPEPTDLPRDLIRVENGMLMEVQATCKGGKLIQKDPQGDVPTGVIPMDQIYRVPPPEDTDVPPAGISPHQ